MNANRISIDSDLEKTIDFMQRNLPTDKLVGVAASLNGIAPLLWGHYAVQPLTAISLDREAIETHVSQPVASESHPADKCVGGDSAGAMDALR